MNSLIEFYNYWIGKYTGQVENKLSPDKSNHILEGKDGLTENSTESDITEWVRNSITKLNKTVSQKDMIEIMTSCSCNYPRSELSKLRELYARNGDTDEIHDLLLEKFRNFLLNTLELDNSSAEEILNKGWGLAGIKNGNRIIATKIPKSGYLKDYLNESDLQKKREYYCHCPLIRDLVKSGSKIPDLYCYCGAGFYKAIWEEIIQKEVTIKLIKSIFKGNDVCSFEIILPD
jgi:hypothetical protein